MNVRVTRMATALLAGTLLVVLVGCRAADDDDISVPVETATPTLTPTRTATPAPTATPSPTPIPTPAAAVGFDQLEAELNTAVQDYWVDGNFAFAVTDLQTRMTIGVNMDRPQYSGCVANLFVLMAATDQLANGRLSLSDVGYLISSTTWSSNATSAKEIVRILGDGDVLAGTQFVGDYVKRFELGGAVVWDHPPLYSGYSLQVDDNNWVTAAAMNEVLERFWFGQVLPEPWRSYLLDELEEVKWGLNYLTAAVPARVSHKNGFFWSSEGYVDNDTGIVRFLGSTSGTEYAYAVTFLSEGVRVKYADITLAQQLMRLTHNFFAETYQ
ncbi:MAG TPA: serine hydrolase [Tepidiformaceae bacterium]